MTGADATLTGEHDRVAALDPPLARPIPRRYLVSAAVVPVLFLALFGVLLLLRPATDSGPAGASVGHPAPELALVDTDGNEIRLSELRGRPVMVNFWASWCGPCVEEFPRIREAVAEHRDEGLTVIGVVYQDRWSSAVEFMEQMDAPWQAAMDPGGRTATAYGIFGPPETFFIDRDGVVAARQIGPFSAEALDRHLARILPVAES